MAMAMVMVRRPLNRYLSEVQPMRANDITFELPDQINVKFEQGFLYLQLALFNLNDTL